MAARTIAVMLRSMQVDCIAMQSSGVLEAGGDAADREPRTANTSATQRVKLMT